MTHPMTIDAERLESDIAVLRGWHCHGVAQRFDDSDKARIERVCDAADNHLATLPRYKEVEVESWAVIYPDGAIYDWSRTSAAAECVLGQVRGRGFQIVRLTGTAKVRA